MRTLFILLAIGSSRLLSAQGKEMVVKTDTGTVALHWFISGELSSKEWMDANDRWGHSWAYDRNGRILFDRQTRKIGGHASVGFSYHPNGAVSEARFSQAPDGGIQWYRSTTTFDMAGVQTGFTEQGMGNNGPVPSIRTVLQRLPDTLHPARQQVPEQRLFLNEYFIVARKNCRVQLRPVQASAAAKDLDATLLKGDTLRGGAYSIGERFDAPLKHVTVSATNAKGRRNFRVQRVDSVQVSPEHRRWYLVIGR